MGYVYMNGVTGPWSFSGVGLVLLKGSVHTNHRNIYRGLEITV